MPHPQARSPSTPARPRRRRVAAVVLALLVAAPAVAAAPAHDPLQKLNRATYKFNDFFDRALARPIAKGYKAVVPAFARRAIGNFVANLAYPTVIVNDALQGKLKDAGSDLGRFLVNSVVGVGGLGDPATHFGLAAHDEDFGQTLGRWGVPAGPYLVLPFLGPSSLRDGPASVADVFTTVDHYADSKNTRYAIEGVRLLDRRTALLSTDDALRSAFDPYALVRNAYQQHREYLVRDGNVPDEGYDEPVEDSAPAPAPAPEAATPR